MSTPVSTRTLLARQRRSLRARSQAVAQRLHAGKSGGSDLRALQRSLHDLQRQVTSERQGEWRAVASALAHVQASLAKLDRAESSPSGAETTRLWREGLQDLSAAYREAKRAGHDWQL